MVYTTATHASSRNTYHVGSIPIGHLQHNQRGRDGRVQQGERQPARLPVHAGEFQACAAQPVRRRTRTFNFCSHCGAQPYRGPPVPHDPHAPSVEIDAEKLQARRASKLAKLEGRPGQQRKSKMTDDFDTFVLAYSDGKRGWETATDNDVLDWCCYLDSQGRGPTWNHDASCPQVWSTRGEACAPASRVDRERLCIEVAHGHEGNVGQGRGLGPDRNAGEPAF